jgi:hypothetical protein
LVGLLEGTPYLSACWKGITLLVGMLEGDCLIGRLVSMGSPYWSACCKGIALLVGVFEGDRLFGRRDGRGTAYWSACWRGIILLVGVLEGDHLIGRRVEWCPDHKIVQTIAVDITGGNSCSKHLSWLLAPHFVISPLG